MPLFEAGISRAAAKRLLAQLAIHPVLVDVGASDTPPPIWDKLASQAVYVGFDPDRRDLQERVGGRFHKAIVVNEAITASERETSLPFYLTRSPYCSSTLPPATAALQDYHFAELFVVERETIIPATTLDRVIARLALPGIDWLKLDTQGTDLRIFNGLAPRWRSRVLALDVEPGLIDAYVGEDLFGEVHRSLTAQGFWLSNLDVFGPVRVSQATLRRVRVAHPGLSPDEIARLVRPSPGWCEARYLRSASWLAAGDFTGREYVLLWLFALLDRQPGFALDLGLAYEQRFGPGELATLLQEHPLRTLGRSGPRRLLALAQQRLGGLSRRLRRFALTRG